MKCYICGGDHRAPKCYHHMKPDTFDSLSLKHRKAFLSACAGQSGDGVWIWHYTEEQSLAVSAPVVRCIQKITTRVEACGVCVKVNCECVV
jgi:hypothetical protein